MFSIQHYCAPGVLIDALQLTFLIVVIANCPHVLDARPVYSVTPARVTAWRGPVTGETDTIRNASLESERAFLNVEEYYRR